jgi:uncharacterized protein YgiM (DUF1202 family)
MRANKYLLGIGISSLLAMNIGIAQAGNELDLMQSLIKENHELKQKNNDLELNYRNVLVSSAGYEQKLKEKDERIEFLQMKVDTFSQKYNELSAKASQYDSLMLQVKRMLEQANTVNQSINQIESTSVPVSRVNQASSSAGLVQTNNLMTQENKEDSAQKVQSVGPTELPKVIINSNGNVSSEVIDNSEQANVIRNAVELNPPLVAMYKNGIGNIRSLPSTDAEVIGKTKKDEFVMLSHKTKDGNWYKIKDKNAWVFHSIVVAQ